VATGFFGLLFSFVLLTDTTDSVPQFIRIATYFLGKKRSYHVRNVLEIVDDSFHNFIVRQCLEAAILLVVSTITLLILGYPYALGVGALMGLAALIPIVGYPVGLFSSAFMVFIGSPLDAIIYLACVALAQVLEATFVLPHVGNPKTALPPVWVTVGVTIGGGVAGFVGMLVAIPIASSIRQLILFDYERRKAIDAMNDAVEEKSELAEQPQSAGAHAHARVSELPESLEETDGDGVGEVE
jgi:predicted PurR-regulated permease PerM